jgi:hypothetical protein
MTHYYYRPDLRDECADREEYDRFDNSDEERDIKRERECEVAYIAEAPEAEDLVIRDRHELSRLVRKEFDATSKGIEGHDARIQWIRVARSLDFYELAEEMTNDIRIGSI